MNNDISIQIAELESQKQELARLISAAELEAEEALTMEEIIATLELFQHGDVNDKDYQEALIDTFLVAAYVYDDRVKFVFNLGGSKKHIELPFSIDDVDLSGVRNNSSLGDHRKKSTPWVGFLIWMGSGFERPAPVRTLV